MGRTIKAKANQWFEPREWPISSYNHNYAVVNTSDSLTIVHIKINAVVVTPLQMFSVSLCQMLHTRLILANGTEPMEQITHTIVKIMGKNGGQNKDKNKNVHNFASV